MIAARLRVRAALRAVQHVLAFVQLAVLKADRAHPPGQAPRVQRRWRAGARARHAALALTAPSVDATTVATAEALPPPSLPPLPAGLHELLVDGDSLRCRRCERAAASGRWHTLAYTPCPAGNAEGRHWTWRRVPHDVVIDAGRRQCTRCNGSIPVSRGASAFVGRRCPVWRLEGQGVDGPLHDWGLEVARLLGVRAAGVRGVVDALGSPRPEPQPTAPPPVPSAGMGLAWRPHVAMHTAAGVTCLSCGRGAPKWQVLASRPCSGWAARLPPRARAAFLAGEPQYAGGPPQCFDEALGKRLAERALAPP